MTQKRFDRELYLQNDGPAKAAIKKYLFNQIIVDTEKRGPDIFVDGTKFGYVEVEIKRVWTTYEFPYDTVQIPARKKRYLKFQPITFFVLSRDLKRAIKIDGKHFKDEYIAEVPNKYVYKGEMFYQIPMELCEIIDLEEGNGTEGTDKGTRQTK